MELGSDTRVLLTGASRGIGRALAFAFAERGATLGLVARGAEGLERLAAELPGDGHRALPADVGNADELRAAVESFGACDVAVANAGVTHYKPFQSLDLADAEQMTRINWLGTLYTVAAALPGMIERGRGHIVVVSSGAGFRAFPSASVYGGTKHAQRGFAEALRHELADTGVSVTLVYPGEIATGLHDHEKESMPDWYRAGEAVRPEPLARKVVEAVEKDRAAVHHPPIVRILRIFNGLSPGLADAILRRLRGRSAAPRR